MDSNGDTKLLISCVGENDELYTSEVLLLFKTIKKFGGNIAANAILVANFVKSIDPTIKQSLEDMGVQVRIVEPAERSKETTSNKIRMLEMDKDGDYDYDVLIALDCDTVVVRDFSNQIDPKFFQAMPAELSAGFDLLTTQQWQELLSYFNWEFPPERINAKIKPIITYFSSAVMSIPKQYIKRLRNTWDDYFVGLFEYSKNFEELADYYKYWFEELALSLTVEKEKIPSKYFPVEMNFHTSGIVEPRNGLIPDDMSPFIFHYHHLYDIDGSLTRTGYRKPDLAIEQVNAVILNSSGTSSSSSCYTTEKKSKSKLISISKDVRVLQKVVLGKQKTIVEKERFNMFNNYWLKQAIKNVETLQSINLGHQKTIEEKDAQLKQAIKDVEVLQSINLGHQKTIEEKDKAIERKDNIIKQLNESMKNIDSQLKQAIKDVEILQSINLNNQKAYRNNTSEFSRYQK